MTPEPGKRHGYHPFFWIVLAGIIIYAQTLLFGFVHFDDNVLILENSRFISQIRNIPEAFQKDVFFLKVPEIYYRPLMTVSLMIDAQFGKTSPFIYHFTNVFLHLMVACLVYVFFVKLGKGKNPAFLFSLLFAVHPVLSQAVSWIPGRNDILLALFVLPAFILFLEYLKTPRPQYFWGHLLFFTLALFTKESALVLVLVCPLYLGLAPTFLPTLRSGSRLYVGTSSGLAQKWKAVSSRSLIFPAGWLSLSLIWFLLRQAAFKHAGEYTLTNIINSLIFGLPALLLDAGKIIFPFNLSVLPILRDSGLWYGLAAAALVIGLLICSKNKKMNLVWFGLAWFLLFLLPSFIRPDPKTIADFTEPRVYVPLLGFMLVVMEIDFIKGIDYKNKTCWMAAGLILVLLSAVNVHYSRNFKDRISFWSNAIKNSPHYPKVHINAGLRYESEGDLKLAEAAYKKALELSAREPYAHYCLGLLYMKRGLGDKAEIEYLEELRVNPRDLLTRINLGNIYLNRGRLPEAEAQYRKAIELDPTFALAHNNLGIIYERRGQLSLAEYEYRKALEINPLDPIAHNNLGNMYAKRGLYDEAESEYRKALEINPSYREARSNLKIIRSIK